MGVNVPMMLLGLPVEHVVPYYISGNPILTATQNVVYPGFTVAGFNGAAPYAYTVYAGTLPTGLTLNSSTGLVSGTPTVVQDKTGIVIRSTDANSLIADLNPFDLVVEAPGVPAWVQALAAPSGDLPALALDFKNGRYWTGTAETTDPLDVLEENTDWGPFDVSSIVADHGLTSVNGANSEPVVKSVLTTALLVSGFTGVATTNQADDGSEAYNAFDLEMVQLPDYTSEYSVEMQSLVNSADPTNSVLSALNQADNLTETVPAQDGGGLHKVAATITFDALSWAIDGSLLTGITPTVAPDPVPTHIALFNYYNDALSPASYLELLAIFVPQPDADLPTLSAP